MHPEIKSGKPGKCSICGMDLVDESKQPKKLLGDYQPLIVIITLIAFVSMIMAYGSAKYFYDAMRYFMGGFFLVFSGFKLIDLAGFADGYKSYDLIAERIPVYGYVYPFIELGLGILFLLHVAPVATNVVTLILMSVSGVGVLMALQHKKEFQCACLGTAIKLPLTNVTLVEDFGMAAMALLMLFS